MKRSSGLSLLKRDLVYLIHKNIKIKRPSLKLDYIKFKPFKIKEKKGLVTFILDLLKDIKIHLTFYISLLKPVLKNAKLVISILLNEDILNYKYEIKYVLKYKLINSKLYFLIKWLGYDESENSWELETNLSPKALLDMRKNYLE